MCTGTSDGAFLCSLQHLVLCVHLVLSTASCWICSEFSLLFSYSARSHMPPFDIVKLCIQLRMDNHRDKLCFLILNNVLQNVIL